MDEFIVLVCTTIAIILVVLGFINRKRHSKQDEKDNSIYGIQRDSIYGSSNSVIMDRELFKTTLSKAGFWDETIEDMHDKILDKKGSVSSSDAIDIIRALDPIMKIRKDDN